MALDGVTFVKKSRTSENKQKTGHNLDQKDKKLNTPFFFCFTLFYPPWGRVFPSPFSKRVLETPSFAELCSRRNNRGLCGARDHGGARDMRDVGARGEAGVDADHSAYETEEVSTAAKEAQEAEGRRGGGGGGQDR